MRITRRDFFRDSAHAGASILVAGVALRSSVLEASFAVPAEQDALKAQVTVDAETVLHHINSNIYGAFIEHVDRCVYGGVYQEDSPVSDEEGFRKDVMSAASEWGVPILRWPGGIFASSYHWEDGVGPKASRPRGLNRAWNEPENNHFGTDEFIRYCRKIGAQPYVCVNLQNGSAQEAANWVEYCNSTGDTRYANLRRKYGHQQPHGVRYWGLGNEPWRMPTESYAKAAFEFGKLMKQVDPTIRLVACGMAGGLPAAAFNKMGFDPEWNRVVLEKLIDIADYISTHQYVGDTADSTHEYGGSEGYYEELGTVQRFEENLKSISAVIERPELMSKTPPRAGAAGLKTMRRIEIAYDEWNIWRMKAGLSLPRDISEAVDVKYNLQDALWAASILNLFQRMADRVTMANVATMVNAIGTMYTNDHEMFRQTIFFPMELYRQQCGPQAVGCKVESPTFSSRSFHDVPYLDVSPTLDANRKKLALAVVNRHQSKPVGAQLKINGAKVGIKAIVFEINGASPEIENSFSQPENVKIVQKEVGTAGKNFEYVFPAHSVTLITLSIA